MMVPRGWCTSQPPWRIRPFRVHRPNRKAECAETCPLRLERGKGCKALPIATWAGAILPGYPAGDSNITSLPNQLGCRLDIFQVREKAGDNPRKRILGNILGIQDRFRVKPEQWNLGKLLDLMVPDIT